MNIFKTFLCCVFFLSPFISSAEEYLHDNLSFNAFDGNEMIGDKVYVQPEQICISCDGIFIYDSEGWARVHQLNCDENGIYYFSEKLDKITDKCPNGFFNKDPFSVTTIPHQHSVALREGARIWQQLATSNPEIILKIAKREDPLIPNWIHVMAIHPTLFKNILSENLSLFQYVLGPTISPESLFSALTSENVTYHSLLKGDKVLIGEILGFGTQNALYISRIENIEEALDQESPPFLNMQAIVREYPHEHLPFEPAFGFNSVRQELEVLHKKVTFPSQKLICSSPEFVF